MAFPKKSDAEKCVKQNISFEPKDLDRLQKYCQHEERSMSWVVRKALDQRLTEKGINPLFKQDLLVGCSMHN